MSRIIFLIFFIFLYIEVHLCQVPSLAEQLGYSKTDKVLILNADDFGMCFSENRGTEKVLDFGIFQSATMMIPCPWALDAVDFIKRRNLTNVGAHLALTSEWGRYRWRPVSNYQNSSLVDQRNYMWPSTEEVEKHAKINDVITELHAQLNLAKKWGVELSHYDSHMGSLYGLSSLRFELLAAALAASYEHGLPFRLPYLPPQLTPFREMGFAILDNLIFNQKVPSEFEETKRFYMNLIKSLNPGVTEMFIHAAIETDELKSVTNSWKTRVSEMRVFCDEEVRQLIKDQNITIINYLPLKKLQREKMNWNPNFRAADVFERYKKLLGVSNGLELAKLRNLIPQDI